MENSDCPLLSQPRTHFLDGALQIARELRIGMIGRLDRNVLPMVAEVEGDQIESIEKMSPIREIRVNGETIPVRYQDSYALRIAVTAHTNLGPVVEGNVKDIARSGKFKTHTYSPLLT